MNTTACPAPVTRSVPYIHVPDLERSLNFYAKLGFTPDTVLRRPDGRPFWASTKAGTAELFFAQADAPVVPEVQAVLFYMYSDDVASLRDHLLSCGLHDGGSYCGQAGPNNGREVVFEVQHPDYMKDGEIRVADPDGYCVLVGQLA